MIDWVLGLIGMILYPLLSVIFVFIEGIQSIFYAFAGVGEINFGGSSITTAGAIDENGGIIYFLFQNNLVRNMLMSIMLLALFLIIIFTVMSFIKNAYAAKQKGWKEIVGSALKGLANFIFIPVCCLLGVWLGNILLQAINGATSGKSGTSSMSRKLFIASASNANRFRVSGLQDDIDWTEIDYIASATILEGPNKGKQFKNVYKIEKHVVGETNEIDPDYYDYYANIIDQIYSESKTSITMWHQGIGDVGEYYATFHINYLVLVVGGVFMLYVLCSLAFAMVRRMFILLMLFIISPGVCAMYPLDEGKAVNSWKGEFIKQVLSAYGAVAGMNIFFSIMPLIDKIEFAEGFGGLLVNDLLQIFILVCGLLCVKEFISLISGFVGGEDAYSKGAGAFSSSRAAMKKYGGGVVNKTVGAFAQAKGQADIEGTGFKGFAGNLFKNTATGIGSAAFSGVTGGAVNPTVISKQWKDSKKAGEDKAFEGYDARTKTQQNNDKKAFNKLMSDYKGRKIDATAANNFLNDIKDDKVKEEYEKKLIAHDNAVAVKNKGNPVLDAKGKPIVGSDGKPVIETGAITKPGKYIERAKSYKEYVETTLPALAKNMRRADEKFNEASNNYASAEVERKKIPNEFNDWLLKGRFNVSGFDQATLKAMFESGQTIDVSKVKGGKNSVEAANRFNEMVNQMIKAQQKVEEAEERKKAAAEAYRDAVTAATDAVKDFAKSAKIDIDTSKLDEEMAKLETAVKDTSKSLEELQKEAKKSITIDKIKTN